MEVKRKEARDGHFLATNKEEKIIALVEGVIALASCPIVHAFSIFALLSGRNHHGRCGCGHCLTYCVLVRFLLGFGCVVD